jgi:hypothetical protein
MKLPHPARRGLRFFKDEFAQPGDLMANKLHVHRSVGLWLHLEYPSRMHALAFALVLPDGLILKE